MLCPFKIKHHFFELLQDWKEKKKLQRRITAAKKVLNEMEQGHILEGLASGEKLEKDSLAEQIGSIDFQLFKHAMNSISKQIDRCELWIPVSLYPERKIQQELIWSRFPTYFCRYMSTVHECSLCATISILCYLGKARHL